jgi:hypothetical protein
MYVGFKVEKNKPYLIVGQGLAGTILAHHFLEAQIPFEIWDASPTYFTSSHAAGGIFNPVTGRKLEKTWLAEELFNATTGNVTSFFFSSYAFVSTFCKCRNAYVVGGEKGTN